MSLFIWIKTVDSTQLYAIGEPDILDGVVVGIRLRSVAYASESDAILNGWSKYAQIVVNLL